MNMWPKSYIPISPDMESLSEISSPLKTGNYKLTGDKDNIYHSEK